MAGDWYRVDTQRVNWLLLRLGLDAEVPHQEGYFWELLAGNATQLVRGDAGITPATHSTERDLCSALVDTIDQYRSAPTTPSPVLVTPTEQTVTQLRRWLATHTTELDRPVSLRGFNHLPLNAVLKKHFDEDLAAVGYSPEGGAAPQPPVTDHGDITVSTRATDLWNLWTERFQLLPPAVVRGDPL